MIRCETCRRRFGGAWGFKLAHPVTLGRCRGVAELRVAGLHRNRHGLWVRRSPIAQQARLWDRRVGGRVREWFGKPYRALSGAERHEYRVRLARAKEGVNVGASGPPQRARGIGVVA